MPDLDERSITLRRKILDIVNVSRQGHIKSAFSCLEIVRVLYDDILKPEDKFIMSKGHGCLAQYVLLAEKGYFPESELYKFCQEGALLGGHPSFKVPGIEVATGALGHGLPIGIGFALAGYRTYVLMGDGECNEGSVWEAAMCAAKHKLSNLTVIIDYNEQQSYGSTHEVLELEPLRQKWSAFGFDWAEVEGHNVLLLQLSFWRTDRPRVLICHTVKGKGIPSIVDNPRWHHKSDITDEEMKSLYEGLNA
uniref:Putative transketolase domain containing protein n=1 Tax=viral metagenome TaxID=1070528 RepID=A0A6M3JAD6_9ZZZZ